MALALGSVPRVIASHSVLHAVRAGATSLSRLPSSSLRVGVKTSTSCRDQSRSLRKYSGRRAAQNTHSPAVPRHGGYTNHVRVAVPSQRRNLSFAAVPAIAAVGLTPVGMVVAGASALAAIELAKRYQVHNPTDYMFRRAGVSEMRIRERLTLSEAISALYGNEKLSDVVFVFPCASATTRNATEAKNEVKSSDQEIADSFAPCDSTAAKEGQNFVRIPGHRMVLAARSSVFSAMLYGPTLEPSCDTVASVVVHDIPVDAFKVMLKYMYSDQLTDLSGANVMDVLHAAKKFQIDGLRALCLEYVTGNVNCDNVCSLLTSALRLEEEQMCRHLLSFIEDNMSELIASLQSELPQREKSNFLELSSEALCYVLKSPYLRADEEDIIRAALNWADSRIKDKGLARTTDNRRNMMLPVLPLLRLGACSSRFLAVTVRHSGVLTRDQLVDALFQVSSGQTEPSAREHWRKFKVGQKLRVQANFVYPSGGMERQWLDAYVMDIRQAERDEIQVHFTGYSSRFDTWVATNSEHLAPAKEK